MSEFSLVFGGGNKRDCRVEAVLFQDGVGEGLVSIDFLEFFDALFPTGLAQYGGPVFGFEDGIKCVRGCFHFPVFVFGWVLREVGVER